MPDRAGAGNPSAGAGRAQPVSNRGDRLAQVVAMSANILTGDIGAEDLIAERLAVENEARAGRPILRNRSQFVDGWRCAVLRTDGRMRIRCPFLRPREIETFFEIDWLGMAVPT